MADRVPLRVIVHKPPPSVRFALQTEPNILLDPVRTPKARLVFETDAKVTTDKVGALRLTGPSVYGPPDARFLYVNSGRRAGEAESCWDRRAKVMLAIAPSLLRQAIQQRAILVAEIDGLAKDGGPCCATVPFRRAWRLG